MISYLILISGIALVLFGADRLTEGASSHGSGLRYINA